MLRRCAARLAQPTIVRSLKNFIFGGANTKLYVAPTKSFAIMRTLASVNELHTVSDAHDILDLLVAKNHTIVMHVLQRSSYLDGYRLDLTPIFACDVFVSYDAIQVYICARNNNTVQIIVPT